jgi:hypothetical protein
MKRHHSPDFGPVLAGLGLLCALGCASAIWPAVEMVVGVTLAGLVGALLLAVAVRWGVRRLREHREDRADLAYAAAVRAARSTDMTTTARSQR